MLAKIFRFSRIQKTTQNIEDELNAFLEEHEFKYATQNESATQGKFLITIFANKKKSTIRAKVFKDQRIDKVEPDLNKFLERHGMKFSTQSYVGSSIYTIVFYDASKSDASKDGTENGSN